MLSGATTFGAEADDAEEVFSDFEFMFRRHRVLNSFKFGGEEFDDLAAVEADHVVVMLVFVFVFVVSAVVAEAHFAQLAEAQEKLDRLGFAHERDAALEDVGQIFVALRDPVQAIELGQDVGIVTDAAEREPAQVSLT